MPKDCVTELSFIEITTTKSFGFDPCTGDVFLVHSSAGLISFLRCSDEDSSELSTVSLWRLQATCLVLCEWGGVVITNPGGRLLRVDRTGRILDSMEIWNRHLVSMCLNKDLLHIVDDRNNSILQMDVNKKLCEENAMVFGLEVINRPSSVFQLDSWVGVMQASGTVSLFNAATGDHEHSFSHESSTQDKKNATVDPFLKLVFMCLPSEKCILLYRKCNEEYEKPKFKYCKKIKTKYSPKQAVFDYIRCKLYVLQKPVNGPGILHQYSIDSGAV